MLYCKFFGFGVTFSADADCCGRAWIGDKFKCPDRNNFSSDDSDDDEEKDDNSASKCDGISTLGYKEHDISASECKELLSTHTVTCVDFIERRDSDTSEDNWGNFSEVHTMVLNLNITNNITGTTCEKSLVFYMYGSHNGYYPPCFHAEINPVYEDFKSEHSSRFKHCFNELDSILFAPSSIQYNIPCFNLIKSTKVICSSSQWSH